MLNRMQPYVDVEKIVDRISSADLSDENYVKIFEKKFSKYINAPLAIATDMGRYALLIGLKILRITKRDEVIVPNFIWSGIMNPILQVSAKPMLVDSQIGDYNISPLEIRRNITSKTKAIMVFHCHGVPCNIEEISTIAKENNCYLIEDCAHSIGAKYQGKTVGTFGDISFFSFHFDKPTSTGTGGMLVINNTELIADVKRIIEQYKRVPLMDDKKAVYGLLAQHFFTLKGDYKTEISVLFGETLIKNDQKLFNIIDESIKTKSTEKEIQNAVITYLKNKNIHHLEELLSLANFHQIMIRSIKSRLKGPTINKIESKHLLMNTVRSLVGTIGLETIDRVNDIRNKNAEYFVKSLKDNGSYILPTIDKNKKPTFFKYTILNNTKYPLSRISNRARKRGFELGNFNWPKPTHLTYPYNKLLSYSRKDLKISEYLSNNIIELPIHYYVDDHDKAEIVEILNQFV